MRYYWRMRDPASSEFSPVVLSLPTGVEARSVFEHLAALPNCLFLDSALRHGELGRYSFVTADPFDWLTCERPEDAFGKLRAFVSPYQSPHVAGLPPFQGGAAGLLGYDLNRGLEQIAPPRYDEFQTPPLAVGLYDVVAAFDHHTNQAWIISQGFPEIDPQQRRRRAEARAKEFATRLQSASVRTCSPLNRSRMDVCAQHAVGDLPGLTSNFSPDAYRDAVATAVEYIHAGDIFQVNLSHRLLFPQQEDPIELYMRLRACNAATFAGYFDLGDVQILSASPERFVRVWDREVEARPIKGTRRRMTGAVADLYAGDDLKSSEKDVAENVMIVDLLRNDLSRTCTPDSVQVTELCRLEAYRYVHHLVSAVRGVLAPEYDALHLLERAFPGGSITGAPKVRAMEIIAELESTARGAYCGSLGYLGFSGWLDMSILIRTMTAAGGWLQTPVGGGIVAQSTPQNEYEETWHKAAGMLQAIAQVPPNPRA